MAAIEDMVELLPAAECRWLYMQPGSGEGAYRVEARSERAIARSKSTDRLEAQRSGLSMCLPTCTPPVELAAADRKRERNRLQH